VPTARELLEQADALMRRNRPQSVAAEGVLPVPPEVSVPASPGNDAAPGPAPEADRDASAAPPEVPAASSSDVEYPVLTDAIDPALAADAVDDREKLPDEGDDVPLLTDAIPASDAEPLVEPGDEGEPSIWPEAGQGEHSVLGRAPDSVISVPPVERVPATEHSGPGEWPEVGVDQPYPEGIPITSLAGVEPPGHVRAIDEIDVALGLHVPPEPDAADVAAASAIPFFEPDLPVEPQPSPEPEPVAEPGAESPSAQQSEPIAAGEAPGMEPLPVELVVAEQPAPPAPESQPAPAPPVAASEALAGEAAFAAGAGPGDDRQWAALAEEIRMQVLQRIDIFTDTGLRGQLGERLKPVVDRASAELLDTINHHVGDLLRAYVAEAIEREIDRWRSGRP
jgi:hypothetical protein